MQPTLQRPVTRSFDVFFDLRLIKWLGKHLQGWWFETLSHPLWRHCNAAYHVKMVQLFKLAVCYSWFGGGQEPGHHCIQLKQAHCMSTGPWFNIKMTSYQYRKSHWGDKTVVRSSYLHNGISFTGKMVSLYWIGPLIYMYTLCAELLLGNIKSMA